MNTITKIKEILVAIIVAGGAVSCMPKLALAKVKPDVPEQFQYTATADTASVADLEWRQFFKDPILQNLIEKGIKNNYDLQIALKQVASSQERLL